MLQAQLLLVLLENTGTLYNNLHDIGGVLATNSSFACSDQGAPESLCHIMPEIKTIHSILCDLCDL